MKRNIAAFLFLIFINHFSFGQEGSLPVDERNQAVYSDRGSVQQPRDSLFSRAQQWVVKSFGNYENAVDKTDRAAGLLVLKTYAPVNSAAYEYLRFTMTINCQDNKYQVNLHELEGIAKSRTVTRLGKQQNDAISQKAVLVNTESNRRKKIQAENELAEMKSDNERVSDAAYRLLASLKQFMVSPQ